MSDWFSAFRFSLWSMRINRYFVGFVFFQPNVDVLFSRGKSHPGLKRELSRIGLQADVCIAWWNLFRCQQIQHKCILSQKLCSLCTLAAFSRSCLNPVLSCSCSWIYVRPEAVHEDPENKPVIRMKCFSYETCISRLRESVASWTRTQDLFAE